MGTHTDVQDERITSAVVEALQHRAGSVVDTEGQLDSIVSNGKMNERRRTTSRRILGSVTAIALAFGAIGVAQVVSKRNENLAVPVLSPELLEMPSFRLIPSDGIDDYILQDDMGTAGPSGPFGGFASFWGDASRHVSVSVGTFPITDDLRQSAADLPRSVEAMIAVGPNGSQPSNQPESVMPPMSYWRSENDKFGVHVTFPPDTAWKDQVAVARTIRIGDFGEISATAPPFGLQLVFNGPLSELEPLERWAIWNRRDYWVAAQRPSKVAEKLDRLGFTGFGFAANEEVVVRGLTGSLFKNPERLSWVEKGWTVTVNRFETPNQDPAETKAELLKFAEGLRPATEKEWSNLAQPVDSLLRVSADMKKPTRMVSQTEVAGTQWKLLVGEAVTDAKCVNISVTSSGSGEVNLAKDCVPVSGGPALFSSIVAVGDQRVLVALFNETVQAVKVRGSSDPNESIVTDGLLVANNPEWTYVGSVIVPLVGNDDVVIEALRVLPSEGIDVDAPDVEAPPLSDEEIAALDNEVLDQPPTESLGLFPVK